MRLDVVSDGALAKVASGHLVREVRSHQHTDIHAAHLLRDQFGNEDHPGVVKVHALDKGNTDAVGRHDRPDFLAEPAEKLVWNHKDKDVCARAGFDDISNRYDVVREFNALEVFDVLMLRVDDLRQLSALHDLLEDPHAHLPTEERALGWSAAHPLVELYYAKARAR